MESDLEKKPFMREKWKRQSRRENRPGMKLQRGSIRAGGAAEADSTEE